LTVKRMDLCPSMCLLTARVEAASVGVIQFAVHWWECTISLN